MLTPLSCSQLQEKNTYSTLTFTPEYSYLRHRNSVAITDTFLTSRKSISQPNCDEISQYVADMEVLVVYEKRMAAILELHFLLRFDVC